tara:strand:+ start:12813 stop:14066 length:1254 start_codon:yes stop_codon:yes gene_type:complete
MKIDIFGVGYVGLTFALVLAKFKHNVKCWDIDKEKIKEYKKCNSDIKEPYIEDMLYEFQKNGNLNFEFYDSKNDINTELAIITIGTSLIDNSSEESHSHIFKLVDELVSNNVKSILLRSTVEIGTCRKLNKIYGDKCNFIFAPERTIEGKAIEELLSLPQIAACNNQESKILVEKCFSPLGVKIIYSDSWEEAELAKLICNVYRDYNFSFANLLLRITRELSIDITKIIDLVSLDYNRMPILKAGPVSGPCLTKDSIILSNSIKDKDVKKVLLSSRKINNQIIKIASEDIILIAKKYSIKSLLFIGLTFKNSPFTTDTRDSHSIELINNLKHKFKFNIYDPYTDKRAKTLFKDFFIDNLKNSCDELVILCNSQSWIINIFEENKYLKDSIKYWLYKPYLDLDKKNYFLGDHKKILNN